MTKPDRFASVPRRTVAMYLDDCLLVTLVWVASHAPALAAGIDIVAPTLPPRTAAASPSSGSGTAPQGNAHDPAPSTFGGAPPPTYGSEAPAPYGGSPPSGYPRPGQAFPSPSGTAAAPPSSLNRRGGGTAEPYSMSSPEGSPVSTGSLVIPQRSAAGGNCRAEPTPDRYSVSLVGSDALPRQHVALGEFRVQQIIHSPDGRWAVALTKLRGRERFGVLTLDLVRCEPQNSADLSAAAIDARFDGDVAIVSSGGQEQRIRLQSTGVR